ncbi:ATP-binding protein [Streptomyces luteolifulvus]|uniref:ATP-binding protein n=1 Tax=Streptomyces luteolifulvus TaxID=2615112 RepID=A0A6H9UST2_9ACTN|nr:ATP-binding protein [Streptomyces luteolifulvus]KAB1141112.1 ATP-binding protein [Streptomyces luteolifulvus]
MTMATAEDRPTGHEGYSVTMTCEAETVPEARRLVHQSCTQWGLASETAQTAALIMSELVTNALKHGRSHSIRVRIERPTTDRVLVAVIDRLRASGALEPRSPVPEDASGRGLVLVDTLADRWGTTLLPWGKRVWAEILVKHEADQ